MLLYDYVVEDILIHMDEQFSMVGDDNVDKIIKKVMTTAISQKMICDIDNKWILTIDFIADTSRIKQEWVDQILSDIQTVNHQFWTKWDSSETLGIPLEYIFKTKSIHLISNQILNMIYSRAWDFDTKVALRVYSYAKKYWYTKTAFFGIIEDWVPKNLLSGQVELWLLTAENAEA